jgi:hypothetical protein
VSISNSSGCDITCAGGSAATGCYHGMHYAKCTFGDREPTCIVQVWHAYMLNPWCVLSFYYASNNCAHCCGRWYAEDGSRLPGLDVLKEVGQLFATSIVSCSCIRARFIYTVLSQPGLPGILDSSPLDARIHGWKMKTQREFDPLEDAGLQISKTILCPTCRNPINASQFRL